MHGTYIHGQMPMERQKSVFFTLRLSALVANVLEKKGLDQMVRENEDIDESSDDSSDDSEGEAETCEGQPYKTKAALTCPLHSLLYEIECTRMSKKAAQIIDPEMGRGHSNLPESRFGVLAKFRAKDVNLHQLHYELSTNIGLLQSNMSWFYKNYGPDYHWELALYDAMGLPVIDVLKEQASGF